MAEFWKDRYIVVRADLLKMVLPFVSSEETRYYLHGVHIEPAPDHGALMVATDGHRLAVAYDKGARIDGNFICRFSGRLRRKAAEVNDCHVVFHQDCVTLIDGEDLGTLDKHGPVSLPTLAQAMERIPPIDGTYPDWRRTIPRETDPSLTHVVLNSNYVQSLIEVGKLSLKGGPRYPYMTIYPSGATTPTVCRIPGLPEFFAVMMPVVRATQEEVEVIPSWLGLEG